MTPATLYEAHPSMFRNHPIWFIVCIVTVIGLVPLLFWWLRVVGTTLTVTEDKVVLRRGLISKATSELWHIDVRNIQVAQGPLQRLLGVGAIAISSAGQSGVEIAVAGIPHPGRVKDLVDQQRRKDKHPEG